MERKFLPVAMLLSLGLLSLPGRAQNAATDARTKSNYVGVHLHTADYVVFYRAFPSAPGTRGLLATFGRQFAPRWTVQLSGAYSYDKYHRDPEYTGTTLAGQRTYGWRKSESWTYAIPLVVRFRLYQVPNTRLQLDLFGGGTFVSTRYENSAAGYVDDVMVTSGSDADKTTGLFVTAGWGLRYPFGKHLEAVFDYSYIRNLKEVPDFVNLNTTGRSSGITRGKSLGLRYRFNLGKPKPAE